MLNRAVRTALLMLAIGCFVGPALAGDADWPGWQGLNRDGRSRDTGLLKDWPAGGPKLAWKNESVGKGYSCPIVVDGTVYVTGDVGDKLAVFALDGEGKQKWTREVGSDAADQWPGARSTPTYDSGKLYVLTAPGKLLCLDAAAEGKEVWSADLVADFGGSPGRWCYAESPLIVGDKVIVAPGGKTAVVALDKATGKKIWATEGSGAKAAYGSCIVTTRPDSPMVVAPGAGGLTAVDTKTGAKLWANPFSAKGGMNCPTPVSVDDLVFWAVGYGKGGICLKLDDKGNATEAWTTTDLVCHHGGYIVNRGYVYGNNEKGWSCIELATGKTAWTAAGVGKGSICYGDGMLYLFSEDGGKVGLATCSPDKLEMKGTFSVAGAGKSWAHPVVTGGKLYLRYDTNLYCYDVKAK